ncbi:MAG: DinB family protein [Trueperaceae bacterium]|nr:DinB family protein [Trueperaceae bacterium]
MADAPPTGTLDHLQRSARYNARVNARLYDACAEVPDDVLTQPTDAALGSILAILEHVLAADRVWMARLRGTEADATGLHLPTYTQLAPLREARDAMDTEIESYFADLDASFLVAVVRSVDSQGRTMEDPAPLAAAHMFNHQTHHRGQVHVLLRRHRPEPLPLDMHRILNPRS